MPVDTEIDLGELHEQIKAQLAVEFPAFGLVGDYGVSRRTISVPALLLELVDLEAVPDEDPGTDQLAMMSRWVARVLVAFNAPEPKLDVRRRACNVGRFVHLQRWQQPVGPARVTLIGPDPFEPELDKFEVWAVEWEQIVHIGPSVLVDEGTLPVEVNVGFAPEIGETHEGAYEPLVSEGDSE